MIYNENGTIILSDYNESVFDKYYQIIEEDYQSSINQIEILSESLDNIKEGVKNFISAAKKKIIKIFEAIVTGFHKAIEWIDGIARKVQILPFKKQIHSNFDKFYKKCQEKNFIPDHFKTIMQNLIHIKIFGLNDDECMKNFDDASQKFEVLRYTGADTNEFAKTIGKILIGRDIEGYKKDKFDTLFNFDKAKNCIQKYFTFNDQDEIEMRKILERNNTKIDDIPKLNIHNIIKDLIEYATKIDKKTPILAKEARYLNKLATNLDKESKSANDDDANSAGETTKDYIESQHRGAIILQTYAIEFIKYIKTKIALSVQICKYFMKPVIFQSMKNVSIEAE